MSHKAFYVCMAYHDHLISTTKFFELMEPLFGWPFWDHYQRLVLLCSGA